MSANDYMEFDGKSVLLVARMRTLADVEKTETWMRTIRELVKIISPEPTEQAEP